MAVNLLKKDPLLPEAKNHVFKKSGTTYVKTIEIQYKWTILNFSVYSKETNHVLESPTFSEGVNDKYNWKLTYRSNSYSNSNFLLYVGLKFVPGEKSKTTAKYQFYLLDSKNEKLSLKTQNDFLTFNRANPVYEHHNLTKSRDMRESVRNLLSQDTLTIGCDITIFENIEITGENCNPKVCGVPEHLPIINYLKDSFKSPEFCDVTLITCGRAIQAHKLILAAHSPVFAAMFKHDMKEKKENKVDLSDVDYDVLMEMLRFIYTGKPSKLDKMADGLLAAADKYALETLKDQCGKELCKTITADNAANLLILGDLYNVVTLKTQVLIFICTHAEKVMESTSYKSMHNTHSHLIDEAFQALVKQKTQTTTRTAMGIDDVLRDIDNDHSNRYDSDEDYI